MAGAKSSNGRKKIRPSARMAVARGLRRRSRDRCREVAVCEMRVCGSYHLRADIFLVTLDESKWAQRKCGNLRRDEKVWNSH